MSNEPNDFNEITVSGYLMAKAVNHERAGLQYKDWPGLGTPEPSATPLPPATAAADPTPLPDYLSQDLAARVSYPEGYDHAFWNDEEKVYGAKPLEEK